MIKHPEILVPSVRRRHVGPYKPYCPPSAPKLIGQINKNNRDKIYSLRSSESSETDGINEKEDGNIDFSVEPSQTSNVNDVIELVEDVAQTATTAEEPAQLQEELQILEFYTEDECHIQEDDFQPSVTNNVCVLVDNLDITRQPTPDTSIEVEDEPLPLVDVNDSDLSDSEYENVAQRLRKLKKEPIEKIQLQHYEEAKQHTQYCKEREDTIYSKCVKTERKTELDSASELVCSHVVLGTESSPECFKEAANTCYGSDKQYRNTYMKAGYELMHFKISLEDHFQYSEKEDVNIHSIYQTTSNKHKKYKSPKTGAINTIVNVTTQVSSETYRKNFEDSVAKKLSLVKPNFGSNENFLRSKLSSLDPPSGNLKATEDSTSISPTAYIKNPVTVVSIPSTVTISPQDKRKMPVHPRMKLNYLIKASSRTPTFDENTRYQTKINLNLTEKYDVLELSDSESTISSHSELKNCIMNTIKNEVNAENINNVNSLQDINPIHQIECVKKEEENINESKIRNYYIESDDDELADILEAYDYVERRKRKISSKSQIQSYIVNNSPPKKPSLVKYLSTKRRRIQISDFDAECNTSNNYSPHKVVSTHLSQKFRNQITQDLQINIVRLEKTTVDNLITCCRTKDDWNDNDVLKNAGMSFYDINRLCISSLRIPSKDAKYKLRQFLKKNKRFEFALNDLKQPKILKPTLSKTEKLKLKEKAKKEEEQKDLESIRRSLLKINAKFLNQRKFWCHLQKGESSHPIVL